MSKSPEPKSPASQVGPLQPRKRSSRGRMIALLGVIVLVIVGILAIRKPSTDEGVQNGPDDYKTRMLGLIANDQYDDAVAAGLKAIHYKPEDADIYQPLAVMCLNRAQKDRSDRERWVRDGISYAQKGLAARPSGDSYLFDSYSAARNLEAFGDLTAQRKCDCYKQALWLLESDLPLLKQDSLMLNGKLLALAPMRKENDAATARLKTKVKDNSCQ
ncbi:MAG: hypothetical protein ABSG25_06970 [Bryobacteraceae bacterium]